MSGQNIRKPCPAACMRFLESDCLIVFIVYVTVMTDTMLYSAIVPILPRYLYIEKMKEMNATQDPFTNQTLTPSSSGKDCPESRAKELLAKENIRLSFLLASKQLVQIFANIAVGPVIDRLGCNIPMLAGYVILVASSVVFALGNSYWVWFTARSLQGVGSACATTGGMALIADRFRDDAKRGKMLGIAIGGFGLGSLVGPPFGSVTYEFGGKSTPFIILAVLSFAIGVLYLIASRMKMTYSGTTNLSISTHFKLLKDPYVMLASVSIIFGGLAIPVAEASMPIWMMETMCSEEWKLGVIFLPGSVGFILASMIFGCTGHCIGRWLICFLSFVVTAGTLVGLPFCASFQELIGPSVLLGVSAGMLDAAIYPIVGFLVDKRFDIPIYGGAYALLDAMFCIPFSLGPLLTGVLVPMLGFERLMYITAAISIAGVIPVFFLRKPLASNELCSSNCCLAKDEEETVLLRERY